MGCPRLTYEEENREIFFQGLWKKSDSDFFRVDYYPFGLQTATSWTRENTTTNNFLYNGGAELNTTTGVMDLFYRNYDPALGRMNQVDPLASKYASHTPYNYAMSSPVTYNDPMGDQFNGKAYCSWCDRGAGGAGGFDPWSGRIQDNGTAGPGGFGGGGSSGGITREGNSWTIDFGRIGQYGGTWNSGDGYHDFSESEAWQFAFNYSTTFGGSTTAFGALPNEGRKLAIHNANGNFVQIDSRGRVFVPYTNVSYWEYLASGLNLQSQQQTVCPTCLDPSTLYKNLFGLSYPGGNNPRSYNGDYNYSYVPTSKAEFPAIGHDRRYDNLRAAGASGLLFDKRTIGADWKFVKEEFKIAFNPGNRNEHEKLDAFLLGIGLGLAALPKTVFTLGSGSPGGYAQVGMWYGISSVGVTNEPSK